MIYICDYCGKIIDPDQIQIEEKEPSKCPYCGRSDHQDSLNDIPRPVVRMATDEEVTSYRNLMHRLSEEQEERTSFNEELIASNKEKIKQAFGSRQAREFEKTMRKDIKTLQYDDVSLDEWKSFLQELASIYPHATVLACMKYTPKKYRKPWTKERIDNIADICGMDEWIRSDLYKEAGISNV